MSEKIIIIVAFIFSAAQFTVNFLFSSLLIFKNFWFQFGSKWEIILEKLESALGSEDKIIDFQTIRMKKLDKKTWVASLSIFLGHFPKKACSFTNR